MNRVLRNHLRHTTIVTLKSGAAFRGVLYLVDKEAFVLRNCELVEAGSDRIPVAVDGELVILRPDVHYLQFV